jgi:hypothetical protein
MAKSYVESLRDTAVEYSQSHGSEYELDDLVTWAIDNGRWELPQEAIFKKAKRDFVNALREAVDKNGVRLWIDAKLKQTRFWAHRNDASWYLRQGFLDEQCERVVQFRDQVIRQQETLNAERRHGEPEFQLTFKWDSNDEIQSA